MLYSIILPILTSFDAIDFCISDGWSFAGSILLDVKASVVCIVDSIMKIVIKVDTSIGLKFFP